MIYSALKFINYIRIILKQTTMAKKLFIKTYGCQMNVYDSIKMKELLDPFGFESTDDMNEADMVILNTCHIREKASGICSLIAAGVPGRGLYLKE